MQPSTKDTTRSQRLAAFVEWTHAHIKGDEKGQAQVFLDRLFQGFGQGGVHEAGATLEYRVKHRDSRGTSFADLVLKPIVLIEMKKRGEDLARHFRQAFDYWITLVPNRPRWTILCNFDEFWIYDFNQDLNEPVDRLTLAELPHHYEALAFLFPTREEPKFRIDRLKVTREAADHLAITYGKLRDRRDVGPAMAQRFILQMLIALFSEDIELLPKHFVTELLEECTDPPKAFDLLGGLFRAMNNPRGESGGRFKKVPYFNGGIFAVPAPVELHDDEISHVRTAARNYNWSYISPDIFGTIFQHSMDKEERHKYGGHYTTPTDIMKIVGPTIVQPWRAAIAEAKNINALRGLQQRLYTFRVLDPACGSGNFLYIAYREIKRIEAELVQRIREAEGTGAHQRIMGFVTSKQFFGLDIIPFAVELAKVTMTLAHKLAIDELRVEEKALPLDNLDSNIRCVDALIDWPIDGSTPPDFDSKKPRLRTSWPSADVIIGNPPFLGAKKLKPERGADYVNAVRKAFPEVPGMADYCVYWIRRSHDHLAECSPDDRLRGRAGLVGTQNIRNNQSRVGGLDHVVKNGVIVEAVDNQPWSGEANVHVSIANWVKKRPPPPRIAGSEQDDEAAFEVKLLIPAKRKLWHKVEKSSRETEPPAERPGRRATKVNDSGRRHRRDKSFELAVRYANLINSALSDQTDVSLAQVLSCNIEPQRVFQGQVPGHEAFILSEREAKEMLSKDRRNSDVVLPFLIGRDVVTGSGQPTRFVIDFQDIDILEAQKYRLPFARIKDHVLPVRERAANEGKTAAGELRPHHQQFLRYWWRHSYDRPEMVKLIATTERYIVCSGVTKRPIFNFISAAIRPDHAVFVFAFDDDYSFGILQSSSHWLWFITKCSKLAERFRYTPPTVFDTFPWPQGKDFRGPTKKQIEAVAEAGREIRRIRAGALPNIKGGLRALYRTLELPGKHPLKDAHAALDAAVLDAYGFSPSDDILAKLLALNLEVARRIGAGEQVIAPGVPASYGDAARLITEDCIRAD